MKKFKIYLLLMPVMAMFICACSSQTDEIYDDFANASRSSAQDGMSDYQKQVHEIAKHVKFDTDSFYIDITLEDAIGRGISEDIYNKWLERLKVRTNEAREIISKGGKYQFVNGFSGRENIKIEGAISRTPGYGYSDILTYPGNNVGIYGFSSIEVPYIKAINLYCSAVVKDMFNQKKMDAAVWYNCFITGVNSNGEEVTENKVGLGYNEVYFGNVPIPGEIGDDAVPLKIGFTAHLESPEDGDYLEKAYFQWMTMEEL